MMSILLLVLAQPLTLNTQPLDVRDEGARVGSRPWGINCTGPGVTCRVDGGLWQVDVAGGSGGGGKVGEAYAADASITAQAFDHDPAACGAGQYASDLSASGVLTCSTPAGGAGGKVAEAYMADASITAQVAGAAFSADASYSAQVALVAQVAYSADASVYAVVATTAGSAFAADAAYFAQLATVAQVAFSADASVYSAAFDHDPAACAVGQYVSDISPTGVLACSTPSGGGGGGAGNFAETQVVLTTSGYFSQTVAASWVTASSRVVCGVFGAEDAGLTAEVVALAQLGVSVDTLNPGGGFAVSLLNLTGLEGTVAIHCTGG